MRAAGQTVLQPAFLHSPSGRLFGVYHRGQDGSEARPALVFVPPFAEEMNRSRRMVALQAQAFAAAGIDSLILDLFGTGESAGDFRDARLALWLDDIAVAAAWVERQGNTLAGLWGLRLGALLAAAAAQREPDRFRRLLLWQPVTDGKVMLTQFLRIRVAASMVEGGAAEKTEQLRAQFAAGAAVEVAGYEVAPELAQALDGLRIDRLTPGAQTRVTWLEIGAEACAAVSPAGSRVVEDWRQAGVDVSAATVPGDPFWTLQETTLAPALLAATTPLVQP
jgi:exosortase A-associated hydrolase 2